MKFIENSFKKQLKVMLEKVSVWGVFFDAFRGPFGINFGPLWVPFGVKDRRFFRCNFLIIFESIFERFWSPKGVQNRPQNASQKTPGDGYPKWSPNGPKWSPNCMKIRVFTCFYVQKHVKTRILRVFVRKNT